MGQVTVEGVKPPRKLSREERRKQLMEATIEVLAGRGYARTTLTEVAQHAGLSHGLVNFHFQTKEKLLTETLIYLAEEYRQNWTRALENCPPDPASQIDALIRADFDTSIFTPARLSAWCAFWGEAQSRPMYQEECGSNDEEYNRMMEDTCRRLAEEGGYAIEPEIAARVLRVTVEGVWLDMMTMSAPYGRDEALRTAMTCAAAFFPKHFNSEGRIKAAG
ncbi:MAG: TetR/AcrR family transcriptional regulator [Oricola sp.]